MVLRVMVVGSAGKMGAMACDVLCKDPQIQEVYGVTRGQNLSASIKADAPDVLVELTDKDSVFENSHLGVRSGVPTVVGASGLTDDQLRVLDKAGKESGAAVLVVPNFSVAAVLMASASRMVARWLPDCEIIEYHHQNKKDAPSATSIYTAQQILQAGYESTEKKVAQTAGYVYKKKIPIHSVRSPGVLAKQDVVFAHTGESLTISLSQIDRSAFVPGLLMAVKQLSALTSGLHFGLEAVLPELFAMGNHKM